MLTSNLSSDSAPLSIDESLIERYIRHSESLSYETRQAIASYLRSNAHARTVAEFYRTYYEELDALADYIPPEVEAFIDSLFPSSSVVPLFPFEPATTHRSSFAETERSFDTISVLVSHKPLMLMCVMQDASDAQLFRLYVLTDEPEKRAHALVAFPESSQHVATDATGTARFRISDQTIDTFLFSTALLHFPIAQVHVSPERLHANNSTGLPTWDLSSGQTLHIAIEAHTLVLNLEAGEGDRADTITYMVYEPDAGDPQILVTEHGAGTLRIAAVPRECSIRFYK